MKKANKISTHIKLITFRLPVCIFVPITFIDWLRQISIYVTFAIYSATTKSVLLSLVTRRTRDPLCGRSFPSVHLAKVLEKEENN